MAFCITNCGTQALRRLLAPVVTTTPAKTTTAVKAGASPSGNVAKSLGTTSAQLDPTLRMEAMLVTESLVYSGTGRNIFSASSVPVETPKPIASGAAEARASAASATTAGTAATASN